LSAHPRSQFPRLVIIFGKFFRLGLEAKATRKNN